MDCIFVVQSFPSLMLSIQAGIHALIHTMVSAAQQALEPLTLTLTYQWNNYRGPQVQHLAQGLLTMKTYR